MLHSLVFSCLPTYVWRSGVVLDKDNTLAEIIEYYDKREITIRIVGKLKRDLMTQITYELDKIHHSYQRLKYRKLIPCNCSKCNKQQEPYFHPFDVLQNAKEQGERKVQCQKSFEMVDVLSLIDDVIIRQNPERADLTRNAHHDITIVKVEGDYIKGNKSDNRRTQNIKAETINTKGAATLGLGDISGTVANTINELPDFNDPNKITLKQLLIQLHNTVLEEDLDKEEKEEAIEQLQAIASALANSQDTATKKAAKKAMKVLRGTAAALPPTASMVTICNQLPELIGKIFK